MNFNIFHLVENWYLLGQQKNRWATFDYFRHFGRITFFLPKSGILKKGDKNEKMKKNGWKNMKNERKNMKKWKKKKWRKKYEKKKYKIRKEKRWKKKYEEEKWKKKMRKSKIKKMNEKI